MIKQKPTLNGLFCVYILGIELGALGMLSNFPNSYLKG